MRRLAVLVVAIAATACGVPTDEAPRALPAGDVPLGLLDVESSTTTSMVPVASSSRVTVFLVSSDRLVKAERVVVAPASVEKVVKALVNGPSETERSLGLASAVNPATTVVSATMEATEIVTIDLSGDFEVGTTTQQIIVALAQIVFTATELEGVTGVRFSIDGERRQVPTGDGTLTSAPVGRVAYASYAPL